MDGVQAGVVVDAGGAVKMRLLAVLVAAALLAPAASAGEEAAKPGRVYFVAPDGEDDNDGSMGRPFATIERAQRTIRQLKTNGRYPKGGVTVMIRGGRYPMAPGLAFDEYDSGEPGSPVTWRAYRGEKPVFDGGWRVPGLKPVADQAKLSQIPPEARAGVRCCDVGEEGFARDTSSGIRKTRAAKNRPPVDLYADGVWLKPVAFPVSRQGEWHLDEEAGMLYVWPPEGCRELVLSEFADVFIDARKLHDVRFGGLALEYGRCDAVKFLRCSNIHFARNVVRNFGRGGVVATGARGLRLTGNVMSGFGGRAISIAGGAGADGGAVSGNEVKDEGRRDFTTAD